MNHGFSLDLRPSFRYRYSVIDHNWYRILQFPVCVDEVAGTCADTIEMAMSPSDKSRWEYIPQLRIRRHTMPYMRGDVFQNALPRDVWNRLVEIAGIARVEFMAFSRNEQILDPIDWDKYYEYEDDGLGVPYQLIKKDEQIALDIEYSKAREAAKAPRRADATLSALPAFVTGNKSQVKVDA